MIKNKQSKGLFGFLLFFITIGLSSSFSIYVYYFTKKATNNSTLWVTLAVLGAIFVGAMFCSLFDVYRRRKMVERPTNLILNATEKIASGDFSVQLVPLHDFSRYDEYDLIFENINLMAKELSKNEILKNDFISNVSHEIKTPLSVIQNYAKALQNENIDKGLKKNYLNGLIAQTKKLSDLISNILKLNKLENQQILPEIEEFDLSELLRVTTLNYEQLFEKKQIELLCDIDDVRILSSSSLLEIVFNNLISNAIKFTNDGGKVEISLKENATHAIIKIKDSGIGISKEVGEHIFEKFYQGDRSHSREGNGLGLALVKRVIDILGGEISVESKLGVGSEFTVKLKKENA